MQSRDLIADSIETVMAAQWYDANISLPGCDKNMPGCLIAMGRLNRPSLMVYGGTIRAGRTMMETRPEKLDIVSAFQCYGEFLAGKIKEGERKAIVQHSCPGAGACGGMYTANTMASAIEALGMSLPYSSSIPAEDPDKLDECLRAGAAIRLLLGARPQAAGHHDPGRFRKCDGRDHGAGRLDERRAAFDRHGPRRGGAAGTRATFKQSAAGCRYLADLKPSGKYVQEDLHAVGGTPAVMKYLLEKGLLDGDCMTVTGRTMAENLATAGPDGRAR